LLHVGPGSCGSMWVPGAIEQPQSVSFPDGKAGDLNYALLSLRLVYRILVAFTNCSVFFSATWLGCSHICFASTSPVTGWDSCVQNGV